MPFSKRSLANLKGVHPMLVEIMTKAMALRDANEAGNCPDFMIIEGMRTYARQMQLFSEGATKTMNSRHLTGHAVDVIPLYADGKASFAWPMYYTLRNVIMQAAYSVLSEKLGHEAISTDKVIDEHLTWGGDWKTFKDGPHWELTWNKYPAIQGRLKI